MNKILYVVLFLGLAPMPHAFGMDKAPTITDVDDVEFLDAHDGTVAPTTQPQPPSAGMTHVASVANGKGQVLHLGVNSDSIAGAITEVGASIADGLTKATPVITKSLGDLTEKIDQIGQVGSVALNMLGKEGAGAITTMGTAGANTVGNIVSAATSQLGTLAYMAGDAGAQFVNSITDEGRANMAEITTAFQNSSNNATANYQKTIQVAGTQASRALGQARSVVNAANGVATTIGTQVNQLAATAMTPQNVKALGDSEAAQQWATHAGNSMNKISGAATSVATHTNQLLAHSKKLVQNAQPIVGNAVEISKNLAEATKHLATMIGAAAQVNTPAALPSSSYQQGPTIVEMPDEPLALPAPEQFATLSTDQRTRSQRNLFSAIKSIINGSTVQVSQTFAANTQKALSKALQGQAMAPEEYTILFKLNQTAQQAPNTGPLLLEWPTQAAPDAGQPAAPASQPTSQTHAKVSELAALKRSLEQIDQQRIQEQQAHLHNPSRLQKLTAVLPLPALVVIASVCVTGLLITAKKLHTKWKKKQQKKEKNKTKQSEKQDTSAQQ